MSGSWGVGETTHVGAGGGGRGEKFVGVVGHAGHFPGEAAEGHAAEDDGEGPDVGGLGVVFSFVVDFGGEVGI